MVFDTPENFLGVSRSIGGKSWVDRLDLSGRRRAAAIAQRHDVSEIMARIMAGRGVGIDEAETFLSPSIRELMPDPSTMTGMDSFADRLARAVLSGEKVALFGDYDVDGASSCALMLRFLKNFSLDIVWHVPDRIFEGYGPNIPAIDKMVDEGASLLILLDCGTTSFEPVARAMERGCDVLVLDHHLAREKLPPCNALVNPNRADDLSELGYLCAAGVAFMALVATNRVLRRSGHKDLPDLMELLDLVALATVCDMVPLKGLNRAFVVRGMEIMRRGGNKGISALALAARIGGPLSVSHLGFMLGPRINAGGRIGDAGLGTRLLSTDSEEEAMGIAASLDELNAERQAIEAIAIEEALAAAGAEIGHGEAVHSGEPPILVLASQGWHPGIVGLVAARLCERFNRPAFAIAMGADGRGTGSGRSIPGVDLGAAIISAVAGGVIEKGGGHAMAAGVSLRQDQLAPFRAFMSSRLGRDVTASRARAVIRIDAAITARTASVEFVNSLEVLGPFGMGNASPVFALASHRITHADIVGKGGHVRCTIASGDGAFIRAIAFRAATSDLGKALVRASRGDPLHFCGTLDINHWQGRQQVQMRLIDAAFPA